jgi:hypothetical protein
MRATSHDLPVLIDVLGAKRYALKVADASGHAVSVLEGILVSVSLDSQQKRDGEAGHYYSFVLRDERHTRPMKWPSIVST